MYKKTKTSPAGRILTYNLWVCKKCKNASKTPEILQTIICEFNPTQGLCEHGNKMYRCPKCNTNKPFCEHGFKKCLCWCYPTWLNDQILPNLEHAVSVLHKSKIIQLLLPHTEKEDDWQTLRQLIIQHCNTHKARASFDSRKENTSNFDFHLL